MAALLLTSKDEKLLHIISAVAAPLWRLEARPLLIKRLGQGYTEGSWWLIEELPYLPGEHTDPEFQQALLLALQAEDPRVAISAIHALQELDVSHVRDMASALQSALLHWTEQGEGAKVRSLFYVVDGCPTCRAGAYNDACTHVKQLLDRL